MLFVLLCKTWNVVKPGAWLARPLSGAQQSQDFPPSYLWCCKSCIQSSQSVTVTRSQDSVQAA